MVVSDHGFKSVEKQIWLRNVLNNAHFGPEIQVMPEGGSGMIYFRDSRGAELVEKIARVFSSTEGVGRVLKPAEFSAFGYPLLSANRQMPDLIVLAKPGYGLAGERKGAGPAIDAVDPSVGAHGYLNTDPDMQAIFIASGYGIKKGLSLGPLSNMEIAPTLASLLGVRLPNSEPPISDILQ
ncbi:MAG: alkaline phosphatase family protein [Bryobacteraceae bacterium]